MTSHFPQIPITDFTAKRRPITRMKLAAKVARSMQKFIEVRLRYGIPIALGSHAAAPEGEIEWPCRRPPRMQLGGHDAGERILEPDGSRLRCLLAARN